MANKMTHNEIMSMSSEARAQISKGESAIWASGTKYTSEELESGYESHVVDSLENKSEPKTFDDWCQEDMGILIDFAGNIRNCIKQA